MPAAFASSRPSAKHFSSTGRSSVRPPTPALPFGPPSPLLGTLTPSAPAIASGLSFAALRGLTRWATIAGLVVGGLFAAPFTALLVKKLSARTLMVTVGLLIASLSVFNLSKVIL
ncbi:hypothetical protein [Hansschlegelia plantiphila]|uniref:Membrane transporter protein n=1 Tax=Hansschlegelia plantiphila TaxID=374655 RepID=A0A9W6MWN2_9HYPH|nr:hypothetical protein [Hansschlegelia plantiphila]GLK68997.1 hypothetical protein GCM10008179_26350 [Hansschlegelia plantiphila]